MSYGNTIEDISIKHIESGIRTLRFGKSADGLEVTKWLKKLEPLNPNMHDDLYSRYVDALKDYSNKLKK